jgi:hypothetical protein
MALTDAQRFHLDTAFSRLLSFAGLPNGLPGFNLSDLADQGDSLATTKDVTLWVDGTNGNDAGTGSQTDPLKTIGAAKAKLPLVIKHQIAINVKAGTYTELLDFANLYVGVNAVVRVTGQDWTAFTPATGLATGTIDASLGSPTTLFTASVTGAGWTVNDLKGHFIEITSGAQLGKRFPIAANSATSFDVGFVADGTGVGIDIRSAGFKFVDPAVILTALGTNSLIRATGPNNASSILSATAGSGLNFDSLRLNTGSNTRGIDAAHIDIRFSNCYLNVTSTFGLNVAKTVINLSDSILNIAGANNGMNTSLACFISIARTIFLGGGQALSVSTGSQLSFGGLMDGQTTTAISLSAGSMSQTSTSFLIRNCAIGVQAFLGATWSLSTSNNAKFYILNATTAAVRSIYSSQGNSGAGGLFNLNTVIIDGCAQGIILDGPFNHVDISGASIKNCTTWGVNMAATKGAGHNNVLTDSATVMTGNTSGDFTLDGSTATSIATLRADADKTLLETAARLNRLSEI